MTYPAKFDSVDPMKCTTCKQPFSIDELDLDSNCFDCANQDPGYQLDTTAIVKELVDSTINSLAAARKISADKLKSDLVAEHIHNHPDKYIKDVVSSIGPKKKNVSQVN